MKTLELLALLNLMTEPRVVGSFAVCARRGGHRFKLGVCSCGAREGDPTLADVLTSN